MGYVTSKIVTVDDFGAVDGDAVSWDNVLKNNIAFSADGIDASTQFIITGRNLVTDGETVKTKVKK